MSSPERSGTDRDTKRGVALKERQKTQRPRLYKVLFHNDDYTTMEFVVDVLMRFFHHDHTSAMHIMLHVHHSGHGVAGAYTKEIAETKVAQATEYAQASEYPLKITMEPE